jgi:hypothetical protein
MVNSSFGRARGPGIRTPSVGTEVDMPWVWAKPTPPVETRGAWVALPVRRVDPRVHVVLGLACPGR